MMPGVSEWGIIMGIALLLFGPKKLPQLGGAVGESIRNFKRGMQGAALDKKTETKPAKQAQDIASKGSVKKDSRA